jgi:exopolysaccharide production protein ExoQ
VPPPIATVVCIVWIVGLFVLDRDGKTRTSKALWISVAWLLIAGSRPITLWFQTSSTVSSAERFNTEANPLNAVVFFVLMAAGLIALVRRGRQVAGLLQANWPVVLYASYCGLSVLWSDYPGAASRKWIRSLGDPVIVLIILTDPKPVAALKRVLVRTGFLLFPISVLLIKYYPYLGRAYSNGWELMYTGITQHKNTLGMICLVFGLGYLWCFLDYYRAKGQPQRRSHLLAHGTMFATVIWLLWKSNSATSWSCFLIAGAVMAATRRSARPPGLMVVNILVATLVSIPVFALFFDSGGGLVAAVGRNQTLTGRTAIWQQVVAMATNPLFGAGFESFWLGNRLEEIWRTNVGATFNEAHNGYLETYLNLGWCGVILLAVLVGAGYRNVIVGFRRDTVLGGLKLSYFVAAVIYSLTEAGFRMLTPIWVFFLLSTIAVPKSSVRDRSNPHQQITPPVYEISEREGVI